MIQKTEFTKLHCGGNDFVLLDAKSLPQGTALAELARRICRRKVSVGADGLLAILPSRSSDVAVTYLNQDGSPAQFCGNGLLSVARWVSAREKRRTSVRIEWGGRTHEVWVSGDLLRGELPPPQDFRLDLLLQSGEIIDYVVIGVPHAVRFDPELEEMDVSQAGRKIRFDPLLAPDGANVDFCRQVDRHTLRLRTYERGVEAETFSCGSGAAAAVYVAYNRGMVEETVEAVASGGRLTVHIEDGTRIFLEGQPRIVYRASIEEL